MIRALEVEIGCPLFDRHSRGVSLTAAGKRLLPYADNILRMFDENALAREKRAALVCSDRRRARAERPTRTSDLCHDTNDK